MFLCNHDNEEELQSTLVYANPTCWKEYIHHSRPFGTCNTCPHRSCNKNTHTGSRSRVGRMNGGKEYCHPFLGHSKSVNGCLYEIQER